MNKCDDHPFEGVRTDGLRLNYQHHDVAREVTIVGLSGVGATG